MKIGRKSKKLSKNLLRRKCANIADLLGRIVALNANAYFIAVRNTKWRIGALAIRKKVLKTW